MIKKVIVSAVAMAAGVGLGVVAGASGAQAATQLGCDYPKVCFYLTRAAADARTPTASYRDVTAGFQTLGSQSRGSYMINNTREDDIVYVHFVNGTTVCMPPRQVLWPQGVYGTADKVRISPDSSC